MSHGKHGFTLIEVAIVLLILSIVVRIAIPRFYDVRLEARATAVRADLQVVQVAAQGYYADSLGWPADLGAGEVPPGLVPYLPTAFTFDRGEYLLDWEHWRLPSGLPTDTTLNALVGISFTTEDRALGAAVLGTVSEAASYQLGNSYTFIFEAN